MEVIVDSLILEENEESDREESEPSYLMKV